MGIKLQNELTSLTIVEPCRRLLAGALILSVVSVNLVWANLVRADDETDRRATAVFDTIMSPYCPGVTLSACASTKATDLRNEVRQWLHDGVDEATIQSRLIETYGATILGVPEGGAAGRVGWLVPILATLGGLTFTALVLRGLVSKKSASGESPQMLTAVTGEVESAVSRELEKRRQQLAK